MQRRVRGFIPMVPPKTTHNALEIHWVTNKRGQRVPKIGKKDELLAAEDKWNAYLSKLKPDKPLRGPLHATIKYVFPIVKDRHNRQAMTDAPDLENITKTVVDVMKKQRWFDVDDAQVCSFKLEKMYGEHPGIFVDIYELLGFVDEVMT